MMPPEHLITDILTFEEFEIEERIFRRYKPAPQDKEREYFSSIERKNFSKGISVNRSKFSIPQDALWSITQTENECKYELKQGQVIYCIVKELLSDKNQTGIKVYCDQTPNNCNKAHCDLKFDPEVETKEKEKILQLKLFLNTIFDETGVRHYTG